MSTMVSTPSKHVLNSTHARPDVLGDGIIRPVYSARKKSRFSVFGGPNRDFTPMSNRRKEYHNIPNMVDGQFDDAPEEDSWFICTNASGPEVTNTDDISDQVVKVKAAESNEYSSKATFPVESVKGIQTRTAVEETSDERKDHETKNINELEQNSMVTPARRQSQTTNTLLSDPLFTSPEEDPSRVPVPQSTDIFSLFGTSLMKNVPSTFSNNSFGSCLSHEHHILRDISVNSSAMSATPSHSLICVASANLQSPAIQANMPEDSATNENWTPERKHTSMVNTSEKKKKREMEMEGHYTAKMKDNSPEDNSVYLETLECLTSSRRVSMTPCNCTKSRCLKLYCDCFQRGLLCDSTICNCFKCQNTEKHSSPTGARTVAIKLTLRRRPNGFEKKAKNVEDGCSCKKSRCLQLYCICKLNKVPCSRKCKCINCHNMPGARKNSQDFDDGLFGGVPKDEIEDIQKQQVMSESIHEGTKFCEVEEV